MKIIYTGGGSAGHVTPNLALIDKMQQHENYYVGTNGIEQDIVEKYVQQGKVKKYYTITASKLKRKLSWDNLLLPIKLAQSVAQCKKILQEVEPDVVFSKGGYVALPVVIACHKLKIPCIIHENDMTVGLSNKISSLFATEFLSAFDCSKKAKTVGLILRDITKGDKARGLQTVGFDGSKPILLVTGGSLGASSLNDAIIKNPQLANTFDVFVLTGKGKKIDCDFVHQSEFVSNMQDVLACTTVCVTRAGTNTIAELTLCQIPFVAVPLTKCSRGEQIKNAKWFAQNGCCLLLDEQDLTDKLTNAVLSLLNNKQAIQAKQRKTGAVIDGTERVLQHLNKYEKNGSN